MRSIERSLAKQAFEKGGRQAFESTRYAATVHEAGHAIIEASLGGIPTRCKIVLRVEQLPNGSKKESWLGVTDVKDKTPVESDNDTHVTDDIVLAANKIAGWTAERLFDRNFREGSSIDEIAFYQVICDIAASKLDAVAKEIYEQTGQWVSRTLQRYSSEHHAISDVIFRDKVIHARQLRCLLRDVENNHLTELHVSDMGGAETLSEGQLSLCRRAATLEVSCEQIEATMSEGRDTLELLDQYNRLSGNLRRILETIGLERKARVVDPMERLKQY